MKCISWRHRYVLKCFFGSERRGSRDPHVMGITGRVGVLVGAWNLGPQDFGASAFGSLYLECHGPNRRTRLIRPPVYQPLRYLSKASTPFSTFPSLLNAIITFVTYAMILRSAVLAGILAVQASAFLVPLEVAKEVEAVKAQLQSLWPERAHTVELSCPGCRFAGPLQDGLEYTESDENTIV